MDHVVHAPNRRGTDWPDGGKGFQPAPHASRHNSGSRTDPPGLDPGLTAVDIAAEVISISPEPCYATAITGVSWVMTAAPSATPAIRLPAHRLPAGPEPPISICATGVRSIPLEVDPSCLTAHHLISTEA